MEKAIAVYLDDSDKMEMEFGWLYKTWLLYSLDEEYDLVVYHHPNAKDRLRKFSSLVTIEMPPVRMATKYGFLNSHYFCIPGWSSKLKEYKYIMKTDCDVFLTERMKGFTPHKFLVGQGGFYNSAIQENRDFVKSIALELELNYNGMPLIGSSFYGKTEEVLSVVSKQAAITEIILNDILKDNNHPSGFKRGISSMLAGELSVNHIFSHQHVNLYILDSKCWKHQKIGSDTLHIHAWHTDEQWSKHQFLAGNYKDWVVSVEDAFLNAANYCQWIATTPVTEILHYRELYRNGELKINYDLLDEKPKYETCSFSNDGGVTIKLPRHKYSDVFKKRDRHEVLFRQIATFLIYNGYIENNIIDLGAWIGDNSIPWAENIHGTVYAIDPSPGNCEFIKSVAKINEIENIKVIQSAISDKNKVISTKMVFGDNLYHCTFKDGEDGEHKMNSYSLDHLHEIGEIDNISFIHLDVEGMEFNVVLGAKNIIEKFSPIITFEQHLTTDDYISLSSHLMQMGYSIHLIDEVLPGCNPDCRNFIAIKEEIQEALVSRLNSELSKKDCLIRCFDGQEIKL